MSCGDLKLTNVFVVVNRTTNEQFLRFRISCSNKKYINTRKQSTEFKKQCNKTKQVKNVVKKCKVGHI